MHTLEALTAAAARGEPLPLLPSDAPLARLPAVRLDAHEARRILQGQAVRLTPAAAAAPRVRLYGAADEFLGVGAVDAGGVLRPRRLFRASG